MHPQLAPAIEGLIDTGHLPAGLLDSYRLLGRLLVLIRLIAPDNQEPPLATQQLIARSLNLPDWPAVLEVIETARGVVLAEWQRLLGPRDF